MLSWFPLFFPFKVCIVFVTIAFFFYLFSIKEPLYLPSNSELQVSIWRLTNEHQVWYEWHAESFISIPSTAASSEELLTGQPFGGQLNSSSSSLTLGALSPLADGKDPLLLSLPNVSTGKNTSEYVTVKIGHTSLHNPGGRSSWIGL